MKKSYLFKITILFAFFVSFLVIAGCGGGGGGGGGDTPVPTANVVVQLQATGLDYLVDHINVSIQKGSGPVLTGVTGTDGIAHITVTETGDYDVIQVTGVDASALAQGSDAGREFVKENPIADPYPNLTYTFGGSFPTVSVTALGSDYPVNATVPLIYKVTVLAVDSYASDVNGNGSVTAGTAGFNGRLMLSNLSFTDVDCTLGIWSNSTYNNKLVLYENISAVDRATFYGGSSEPLTPTSIVPFTSYTPAGPIYFEAPGTDSGDWALGFNLSVTGLQTRNDFGGADPTLNFPQFYGGVGNYVFVTMNDGGGSSPRAYSLDYRIFQFDEYPTK